MSPFTADAPTDAQIAFVASLAREHGYPVPPVYSKQHASLLIEELRAGRYAPDDRPEPADRHEETEADRQTEARETERYASDPHSSQDGLEW